MWRLASGVAHWTDDGHWHNGTSGRVHAEWHDSRSRRSAAGRRDARDRATRAESDRSSPTPQGRYSLHNVNGLIYLRASKEGYFESFVTRFVAVDQVVDITLSPIVHLVPGTTLRGTVRGDPCDPVGWDARALCQTIFFTAPTSGMLDLVLDMDWPQRTRPGVRRAGLRPAPGAGRDSRPGARRARQPPRDPDQFVLLATGVRAPLRVPVDALSGGGCGRSYNPPLLHASPIGHALWPVRDPRSARGRRHG